MSMSATVPCRSAIASTISRIIARGTGLIAGSPGGTAPQRGDHRGTVGDVGVVAGILDDCRGCPAVAEIVTRQREGDARSGRQRDLDRIGEIAVHERRRRSLGGGGRAGACRPAALERSILGRVFVHAVIYRTGTVTRHEGKR